MSRPRLTILTAAAVLAGTAVFFTLLTVTDRKKAAQTVSEAVSIPVITCTGAFCYDTPQTLTAADFCDFDGTDSVTQGAVLSFSQLVDLSVNGLREGTGYGAANYQVLESALALVGQFTAQQQEGSSDTLFRLTLPPGVYELDGGGEPLHLFSRTWLSMEGVTLRKSDLTCSALLRNTPTGSAYSGYEGNSDLILTGGVWEVPLDAFHADDKEAHFSVLRFGHCHDLILAGVTVSGCVNGHHLELCGVRSSSILDCAFQGYLDTEYHGTGDKKEAIQLDVVNNHQVAPGFSHFDDTITQDVLIYGCQFRTLCRGIGGHNAVYGRNYTKIAIRNNTFSHLSGEGIYALNYAHAQIIGNQMKQVAGGVTLLALTDHPNTDGYYPPVTGNLPPLADVRRSSYDLTVTDNTIQVSHQAGTSPCAIIIKGGIYQDDAFSPIYGGGVFWVEDVTLARNTLTGGDITLRYVRSQTSRA